MVRRKAKLSKLTNKISLLLLTILLPIRIFSPFLFTYLIYSFIFNNAKKNRQHKVSD